MAGKSRRRTEGVAAEIDALLVQADNGRVHGRRRQLLDQGHVEIRAHRTQRVALVHVRRKGSRRDVQLGITAVGSGGCLDAESRGTARARAEMWRDRGASGVFGGHCMRPMQLWGKDRAATSSGAQLAHGSSNVCSAWSRSGTDTGRRALAVCGYTCMCVCRAYSSA